MVSADLLVTSEGTGALLWVAGDAEIEPVPVADTPGVRVLAPRTYRPLASAFGRVR